MPNAVVNSTSTVEFPLTLNLTEAANLTGLSEATIRRWEKIGMLQRVKMPPGRTGTPTRALRFRRQDLLALIGITE
jgi:DNA-binding transcriptional MerR regulator